MNVSGADHSVRCDGTCSICVISVVTRALRASILHCHDTERSCWLERCCITHAGAFHTWFTPHGLQDVW